MNGVGTMCFVTAEAPSGRRRSDRARDQRLRTDWSCSGVWFGTRIDKAPLLSWIKSLREGRSVRRSMPDGPAAEQPNARRSGRQRSGSALQGVKTQRLPHRQRLCAACTTFGPRPSYPLKHRTGLCGGAPGCAVTRTPVCLLVGLRLTALGSAGSALDRVSAPSGRCGRLLR
jgi:hypothetical protein